MGFCLSESEFSLVLSLSQAGTQLARENHCVFELGGGVSGVA